MAGIVRLWEVDLLNRRYFLLLTGGVALAQTSPEPKPAPESKSTEDEPVATFTTGISLVKVDAKVNRRDGRAITDLGQSDFVVYDEGEPKPVSHFASESDPTQVLLLLDVSASMWKSLSAMSARAREALRMLRPGDQVGVMLFATRTELLQPLTTEWDVIPRKISNAIYKETLGRSTLLNDALSSAARYLDREKAVGRRTVVVVTDNDVGRAAVSDGDALRDLHAADAVLNAIIIGQELAPLQAERYKGPGLGPPDLFRYAQNTGGEIVAEADAAAALKRILERVTTRYSLHYPAPPAEPGAFRRIRIELSPSARRRYPDAVIQARSGYEVGK